MTNTNDRPVEADGRAQLPPLPRAEAILPATSDAAAQRELYNALMDGLAEGERGQLEELMVDNIVRLRNDGDGYTP